MKYEIDIEGLPEGWELVELRFPDDCIQNIKSKYNKNTISIHNQPGALFTIKKIKPRRIVLEETEEFIHPAYAQESIRIDQDTKIAVESKFVWRLVKEEETK